MRFSSIATNCRTYRQWMQTFFEAIKKKLKRKICPPRFKPTRKYKSFILKQAGNKLLDLGHIRIGKNIYKFFNSLDIDGEIKTLTIKRDMLGDIHICFHARCKKKIILVERFHRRLETEKI